MLFHRASVRGVHDGRFSNTVFKLGSLEATDAELERRRSRYAYKKYVQQVNGFIHEVKHLVIDE